MNRFWALSLLVLSCIAVPNVTHVSVAAAQGGEGDDARDPDDPTSMAFRAADGADLEDVDGGAHMVASYGIILVLLLGYVLYLARIQAGTSGEIARLRATLEKGLDKGPAKSEAAEGDAEKA